MSEFKDVTIVREANVFFDGGVTSRAVIFADGSKKTLGIMQPGQYEFTTDCKEIMEIISGELDLLLPGDETWKQLKGGETFEVPSGGTFTVKVRTLTDYCCSFIQ